MLRLMFGKKMSLQKPFIKILCALWTLATLTLSIIGLFTAWTGTQVSNLVNTTTQVSDGRLWIFTNGANITASYLGCGIIISFLGFAISKYISVKIAYLFVCLIAMITNSLTDTRASFIMLAFMISGTLCIGLWTIFQNQKTIKLQKKKTALIICILILCFCLCFILSVNVQQVLGVSFIDIRNNGGIIPSVEAEETVPDITTDILPESTISSEQPTFEQRDVWFFEDEDISKALSYRPLLWQRGIRYIQKNPQTLLFGTSIDGTVAKIVDRLDHSHNILLQTLLEGGIPALLLYLFFVFYCTSHALRLWNRRSIPFWQRMLPLPVFSILLWEMAECLTHFSYGHPPMTLFWFFLGATITVSKSLGKAFKSSETFSETKAIETGE